MEPVIDQELKQPVRLIDIRIEGVEEGAELAVRIEAADVPLRGGALDGEVLARPRLLRR